MNGNRWVRISIAILLVLAGCSQDAPEQTAGPTPLIPPNGEALAQLAGIGSLYSGTVVDAKNLDIRVAQAPVAAPTPDGVLAIGQGMRVDVDDRFSGRFEVRLTLPPEPDGEAIPGVLHIADDGSVSVEPGLWDPKTNEIIVQVAEFSDRFGVWWDPRNWGEEVIQAGQGAWDFVVDWTTGRTDPPPCRQPAPRWSSVATSELSSVHVCLQSNPAADGIERAELFLKGNRNTLQLITVPAVANDYLWVENQPQALRTFLASFGQVDPATNILLVGGDSMSIGFRQPDFDLDIEMRSYLTWPIVIVNPLAGLLGGIRGNELQAAMLATWACVNQVGNADLIRLDVVPGGFSNRADFVGSMVKCALELASNPSLAISVFDELMTGLQLSVVDRNGLLGNARTGLDRIEPIASRLARVLAIGGVVTNAWDGIFDGLAEGQVSLTLTGSRGSAAPTERITISAVSDNGRARPDLAVRDVSGAASCSAGSSGVGDGAAYRCVSGSTIYDPCWADATTAPNVSVVCLTEPWSTTATRLYLGSALESPLTDDPNDGFPWGMALASGERCVALQGSRDVIGDRVIDYYCGEGNPVVLRGLNRDAASWRADLARYVNGAYLAQGSRAIRTVWYGESGPGGAAGRNATMAAPAADARQFLTRFLDSWWQGQAAELSAFATPEALGQFEPSPAGWVEYSLNWRSECALRSTGTGTCGIGLISPEGGGVSYSVSYGQTANGLRITGFEFIGGGA